MSVRDRLGSLFKGKEELDLTSGGIGRPLFFLSFPIIITNLLQVMYNLADTFWLGQYSTPALAAISFGFPLVYLLISLGMGLSVAGSVLVAQHTGADEPRKAEYAASQTVTFSLIGSAILGALGFFLVGGVLDLFGAEPLVLDLATEYMRVIAAGLPFMFGFFVFIALMRGSGDTITPMVVMFGTVVLNIVLDPILIFGFQNNPLFTALDAGAIQDSLYAVTGYTGNGVEGAAIATVFARASAMVVGMAIMLNGSHGIRIRISEMVPDFDYLGRLLRIGVPASVENTGRALSVNLLLFIVGTFSTTVVAAFGVGIRVFSLIFMPAIAVDRGVETMTGQNIGAGKPDRAAATNHFAAKVTFLILAALGAVIFVIAPQIMAVFTNDAGVIEEGARFLRWVAPTFGFMGVLRAYTGGLRGAGKTLTAAAIAILMFGVIRLPVAWVASQRFGPDGIWFSFAVSNVAAAAIAFGWFQRGTWREADLTDDETGPGSTEEVGDATPTDD
ncbi:MATE family efflux transporter [Halorientalis salina]|uniref:MATE family efflux transporter n=1 Tax=Halorientalis salina TaxID=2932266 RepID=UPI0010AB73ED|nr:MATE family efflux transporter [Halorientalis salina]